MVSGSQDTQRTHLDKTSVQEGFSRGLSTRLLSPPPGCEEPEPPGPGLGLRPGGGVWEAGEQKCNPTLLHLRTAPSLLPLLATLMEAEPQLMPTYH